MRRLERDGLYSKSCNQELCSNSRSVRRGKNAGALANILLRVTIENDSIDIIFLRIGYELKRLLSNRLQQDREQYLRWDLRLSRILMQWLGI